MQSWRGAVVRAAVVVAAGWTIYWLYSSDAGRYATAAFTQASLADYREASDQAVAACHLQAGPPPPQAFDYQLNGAPDYKPVGPPPDPPDRIKCYHSRMNDWSFVHPNEMWSDDAFKELGHIAAILIGGYGAIGLAVLIMFWIALGFGKGTQEFGSQVGPKRRSTLTRVDEA